MRRCTISIIYLIRHGETDWNRDKRIQGQTDIPLNKRGRRQAEVLAERLASIPLDMIYTSDLGRVRETTQIIAAAQPREVLVIAMPELRECNYGLWEGLTRDEIAHRFAEDWDDWIRRGGVGKPTGGEDYITLVKRSGRLCDAVVREGKTVLISTHLGPLRAIICHTLGLEPLFLSRFWVTNCSLSTLACSPGARPQLILLNDTCHLDGVA